MDFTDGQVALPRALPRALPFSVVGGRERRACAAFALADGGVLALQVTCMTGDEPTATAFRALQPANGDGWSSAAPLVIEQPVPAALSLTVSPILTKGRAENFAVAWPFEFGGYLSLTAHGVSVVEGPEGGRITALCTNGGDLYAATGHDGNLEAGLFVRSEVGGWGAMAAGSPPCDQGEAITALATFQGHLHAATSDARAGFSLWRTALGAEAKWEAIMTCGAWRHGYNRSVSAMAAIGARLYVAADGPDTGHLSLGDEYPEILAVDADGGWQLFSGQGRFTPDGLRLSATIAGPGSPDDTGLTVGGLQEQGEDILVWLKPRDAGGAPLSVRRWSEANGAWSASGTVPLSGVAVTTLAVAGDGTVLVAAGADLATVPSEAGPRPLLVTLTL